MTLAQMAAEAAAILEGFDDYAREGRCEGDLFWGWDYPTMAAVFPEETARLRELRGMAKDLKGGA